MAQKKTIWEGVRYKEWLNKGNDKKGGEKEE